MTVAAVEISYQKQKAFHVASFPRCFFSLPGVDVRRLVFLRL